MTQDGVVPRTKLPEILKIIAEVGKRHDIRVANVFHAGDGNIHPILLFDNQNPDEVERVLAASDEILTACIELGGSVTGEHGVGIEKVKHVGMTVLRRRSGSDDRAPRRLRPRAPVQPGQALSKRKGVHRDQAPQAGRIGVGRVAPDRSGAWQRRGCVDMRAPPV